MRWSGARKANKRGKLPLVRRVRYMEAKDESMERGSAGIRGCRGQSQAEPDKGPANVAMNRSSVISTKG